MFSRTFPLFLFAVSHAATLEYPSSPKEAIKETLHGIEVADPYRWLEDDQSEATRNWIVEQNQLTQGYLKDLPNREAIRSRLKALWNFERIGQPAEYGGKWFFTRNSGLQNQSVLMVSDSMDGEARVLIDPNGLSEDGTVSLADWEPSDDGSKLIWAISRGGSDWRELRILDVESGEDLEDVIKWVKFSRLAWKKDGSGFFYSRYDEPAVGERLTAKNSHQKLYFHRLGTPQSEDELIYERPDEPEWGFSGSVTEDGKYLVISVFQGTSPKNRFFYREIEGDKVIELLSRNDASYGFIGNVGGEFYFRTNRNAPKYRVVAIDVDDPRRADWREVIPEGESLLRGATLVGGQLIANYLDHASSAIRCFQLNGESVRRIELPGIGTAVGFHGRSDASSCFYRFTSFTEPGAIYRLDLSDGSSTVWKRPEVDFDSDGYVTKQVFIPSKDGTKVPVFIVHKRGLQFDGSHRTLLYGYGGFNVSLTPSFSVSRAVWLERGGVYVLANLRGGGEYGSDWHAGGMKLNKQNVFDDFLAVSEWLIEKKVTTSSKLAIQGGSNGGLLVGACMTQRPDLFGACLPSVGVMDMLRFHRFTIGWAWEKEYGSPEEPEDFKNLLAYSPYHRLEAGVRYPATLVTTADRDDRVVPAHSFKFAARLQEMQEPGGPPVLIRIDTSAGHGAGTALDKVIERVADQWAFLEANLR